MDNTKLEKVFEVLDDLRGYSGVGEDGNPYDTPSWNAALSAAKQVIRHRYKLDTETIERKHIGYVERDEGFYKIYAPVKGQIVTQAFMFCKYCNDTIYHCMGPRYDAVCLTCFDKDPDDRNCA